MATAFTHGVVAAALTPLAPRSVPRRRLALVLVALAIIPDLDALGLRDGIPYGHPLGHRGFTHSLCFAALGGVFAAFVCTPLQARLSRTWWQVAGLGALATASHGLLDAFTDAGLGVGFFLPFDSPRYFFSWRPLRTSPLSLSAFFSAHGARILANEILWVWLPLGLVVAAASIAR